MVEPAANVVEVAVTLHSQQRALAVEFATEVFAVAVKLAINFFAAATTQAVTALVVSMVKGRRASTRTHDASILSGPVLSREQGFFFVDAVKVREFRRLSRS
ncbi:hypothetical protein [Paraburkholderia phenoliruptrix]|uniref:hypothetical protein n=1 Tax=Paraburkholderia phenoliruptrix TaxID=252970 RepID=UPI0028699FCE|nr:hypothetical protein [Paraburkholderia phenoliruptrix]WMY11476.1 hypothetical protein P3F88_18760 [Paraburkholderia phenoliruptrix]